MRDSRTPSRAEGRAASSLARRGARAEERDPLSDAQSTLGNRDFGRVMTPAAGFVVEDDAENVAPGQMRRSAFLAAVRAAVCGTAHEGFAGTGRTADDCPWIEHWLSVYEGRDAEHLNGALRRFAPETAGAATAREAIAMIAARARVSVDRYVATGEISGIPEGFSPALPGLGLLGGMVGGLLFKARPGGPARSADDPGTVRAQLGAGQPIPGAVRTRMERVFGTSFSHVRVHRDGEAAALSSRLNARAFTVGEHVAFGPGEYRPGTVVGDALLAHELAHVVQQGSGSVTTGTAASEARFEAEADRSAAGAVERLWIGSRRLAHAGPPRLRSGLTLNRCAATTPSPRVAATDQCPAVPAAAAPAPRGRNPVDAPGAGIIALANDTRQSVEQRAVALVRAIICQYYPNELSKVAEILHDDTIAPVLETERLGEGEGARGRIRARSVFVTGVAQNLAHEVLRVRHELDHIDQFRRGMTGPGRKDEREFLAYYREAFAPEPPGTGTVSHITRQNMIDAALGHYYCLEADLQRQYAGHRDRLLERRPMEERASGHEPTPAPTVCQRSGSASRRP